MFQAITHILRMAKSLMYAIKLIKLYNNEYYFTKETWMKKMEKYKSSFMNHRKK